MFSWPAGSSTTSGTSVPATSTAWPYDWTADTQLYFRYKAGSLADMSPNGPMGPLVATGGSVVTTSSLIDGQSAWQFTKGAGVRLTTAISAFRRHAPLHFFIVFRSTSAGGAPAATDRLFDFGPASPNQGIVYDTSTTVKLANQNVFPVSLTASSWNLVNWYKHSLGTRYSVNGAAYTTEAGGVFDFWDRLCIGAFFDGTKSGGWDVAEVIGVEGQASPQLMSGLTAYLRATYPSLGIPAAPPASFDVAQTSRGALPAGAFDIIFIGGQSNNCSIAATACQAAGARLFSFDHDNTIIACPQLYDQGGSVLDEIVRTGTGSGGNATSLGNTYSAATGRNVLIVPCANGGAGLFTPSTDNIWDPAHPRGNKLRNSLYGSALARLKNARALGGTFRFIWWYQGESNAQNAIRLPTFAADTAAIWDTLCVDAGIPKRVIVQTLPDTVGTATAPNIATVQAAQASLAQAGVVLVAPKNNNLGPDNLHLNGTGCDQVGTAAANLALAQAPGTGWY